jgi:hypothetical protein
MRMGKVVEGQKERGEEPPEETLGDEEAQRYAN